MVTGDSLNPARIPGPAGTDARQPHNGGWREEAPELPRYVLGVSGPLRSAARSYGSDRLATLKLFVQCLLGTDGSRGCQSSQHDEHQ